MHLLDYSFTDINLELPQQLAEHRKRELLSFEPTANAITTVRPFCVCQF